MYLNLAIKNVFRNGKRSLTLGVNYAIVALILTVLAAFTRGAQTNVTTSLVRATAGHITISGQYARDGKIYNGILGVPEIERTARETLGSDAVVFPRYRLQSSVYYKGFSKRLPFTGIDAARDTGFREQMIFQAGSWDEWAADPNGVVLPESIAEYYGLAEGEEVVLSTRSTRGAFNTGILKVRGIYTTDNYFLGGLVLAHFDFLRDLDLAEEGTATTMYIYFDSPSGLAERREALSGKLREAGFEATKPASDSEAISAVSSASVRYEVDKEGRDRVMLTLSTLDEVLGIVRSITAAVNAVGALVAAIMLFVIAVSVFINLRMSINERLREIGTMRAIGVDASSVTKLFVLESSALAFMASAAGAILGALACLFVRLAVPIPPGGNLALFLDSGRLALEPNFLDMALLVLVITALAAAFSFFPARRGGSITPVEALASTF